MKILHTADWHIGQMFYNFDRTYEHRQFLNWLVDAIVENEIDLLLVSGDVFDNSNPAAASIKMFYTFLKEATEAKPELHIIITAGNHDSASRLETPIPLLSSINVHISGNIERTAENQPDYEKLTIAVKNVQDGTTLWCLAIPFLKTGDLPIVPDSTESYGVGVAAFYKQAYEHVANKLQKGDAILAMGHLHTMDADLSDDHRKSERDIMGGIEFVPATAFHENFAYTALGHIHKAQRIAKKDNIRYSGSPIPMSFSEKNYRHTMQIVNLRDGKVKEIVALKVPVAIPLMTVPDTHLPLEDVLNELRKLPDTLNEAANAPYLEVRVLSETRQPYITEDVRRALNGKHVRLTNVNVKYLNEAGGETTIAQKDVLNTLKPIDILTKIYKREYKTEIPATIAQLFAQVEQEVQG